MTTTDEKRDDHRRYPGPAARPESDRPRAPAAMVGLFVLAIFTTLYFARAFILPVTIAILATLVLRPVVRALRRIRIPDKIGAALVLASVVTALAFGLNALAVPAVDFVKAAPQNLRKVEAKLRAIRKPVEEVSRATDQVEQLALGTESSPGAAAPAPARPSLGASLASGTRVFLTEAVMVLFLCYFLLASWDDLVARLSALVPGEAAAKHAREVGLEAEREVSHYLFTISIINLAEGACIAGLAWALGMPSPLLWGVLAAAANFVPFLGAIAACLTMTLTALVTLPSEKAILVPVAYLIVSSTEGYLVTPLIVGRRLTLDPVMVFLGVIFWGWLWGIPGTLIAVPILAATKIVCEHVEALAPIATVLGRRNEKAA